MHLLNIKIQQRRREIKEESAENFKEKIIAKLKSNPPNSPSADKVVAAISTFKKLKGV